MKNVIFLFLAMACFNMLSAQLNSYTTPTKTSKDILKKLPKKTQQDFWKGAVFSNGELVSVRIEAAKNQLSKADFGLLLATIGFEACDVLEGYKCDGPGQCIAWSGYACCAEICESINSSFTTGDFDQSSNIPKRVLSNFYSSIVMSKGKIKTANYQVLKPYLSSRKYNALAKHMKS